MFCTLVCCMDGRFIHILNEYIRNKLDISRQTATTYLKQLEKVGILSSEKIGKEIIYKNISLFKIAED